MSTVKLNKEQRKFIERLYNSTRDRFWYIAIKTLHDKEKAADIIQTTYEKLSIHVDTLMSIDSQQKIINYGLTVLKNLCRESFRKQKDCIQIEVLENCSGSDKPIDDIIIMQDDLEKVERLLPKIKEIYREAIHLRYHLELPYEKIGGILGISAGNARQRVFAGLRQIKTLIDVERGETDG